MIKKNIKAINFINGIRYGKLLAEIYNKDCVWNNKLCRYFLKDR